MRRRVFIVIGWLVWLVLQSAALPASASCDTAPEMPGYVRSNPDTEVVSDWPRTISECLPILPSERGTRWPLVMWESGPPETWDQSSIQTAAARGVVPTIRLDERWLPLARLLQTAGQPVIVIEARSAESPWPYPLAGDGRWALEFGEDQRVHAAWRRMPVPTHIAGWAVAAQALRERLMLFKAAGIHVDAFWLDYENQPDHLDYEAVRQATNVAGRVPDEALRDAESFRRYRRQLWLGLLSAYVAAPIREVFPDAAVTNWMAVVSTPEAPVLSWEGSPHPGMAPGLFTHTNPVAYGIDLAFAPLGESRVLTAQNLDWLYLHILLRQVSADAASRRLVLPYLGSVAWVARWVADLPGSPMPAMGRETYREALRHLWLRDLDAMAVFNPARPGYAAYQWAEVEDAARVYAEMLVHRQLLDEGEALNLEVPEPYRPEPLWSGVRAGHEALIRIYNPLDRTSEVSLVPWPGVRVILEAPPGGIGYLLRHDDLSGLSAEVEY